MLYIRKIGLFSFLFCIGIFASAQLKEDSYEGFKIKKNKLDIDLITIKQIPIGNGVKQFYDGDTNKGLDGTYHIVVHAREYIIANFKKGLPSGDWEGYRSNELFEKSTYRDGKLHGTVSRYTDRILSSEKVLEEGVEREYISYLPDGSIQEKITYDEKGRKHGAFVSRDNKGNVAREETFIHGRQEGKCITYHDGVKTVSHYRNGKMCGEYTKWYENGVIEEKGTYDESSKKTGTWVLNNQNGSPYRVENYLSGEYHGERIDYFGDGKPRAVSEYKNGRRHGKVVYYQDQPYGVRSEYFYRDGKQDGEAKEYRDGELTSIAMYVGDKKHGETKEYTKGVLSIVTMFREGKMISRKFYKDGKLSLLFLVDEKGSLVKVAEYNKAGQRTFKSTTYKKPSNIRVKEDASGVIDIEFD